MCLFGHFKCSVSVRAWVNICSASHFSPHPPTNWQPLSSSSNTRQTSNIRDLQIFSQKKTPFSCQSVCHCHCIDWSSNTKQKNQTKKWRTKARNSLWTTRFWDCIKISFRVLQKFYANDLTPNCPVMSHPLLDESLSQLTRKTYVYICGFMPAGDNNRPNLMASPYLGLRHPVLWKGHQCQRKNEKFSDNFSLRCNCSCAGVKPLSKRRGRVLSWSWRWLKLSQTDISWPFLQIAVGSMSVSMGQWLATSSVPMGFSGTIILTPVTSHGILNVILEVPKTTCTQRHVCICYGS